MKKKFVLAFVLLAILVFFSFSVFADEMLKPVVVKDKLVPVRPPVVVESCMTNPMLPCMNDHGRGGEIDLSGLE